jgi:guanine nucleotide-binding protein G(I)/G(S)/G(O) subunit gamma-13
MDASVIANMDRDALKKQIDNMKYQASMERWPLSKSIQA